MAGGCDWKTNIACLCVTSLFLGFYVVMPVMLALFAYPSSPLISVNLLDNQPLNMTTPHNSPMNMTIHFDLKLKNRNKAVGLHYPDPLKITFSYFPNVSMMVILADYEIDSFYQGNGKSRHVSDTVETIGFPTALEGTEMVAFRVDLLGSYRYKKAGSKTHKMEVGCIVFVDYAKGLKLEKGFVTLVEPGLDSKLQPPVDYVAV